MALRTTRTAARNDLETLRAAINHHRQEGHCDKIVSVVLPEKPLGRERWCTRSEAAKLLLTAWRFRERQGGKPTDRRNSPSRRQVHFSGALYRHAGWGVCAAALEPTEGRGWVRLSIEVSSIGARKANGRRKSAVRPFPYLTGFRAPPALAPSWTTLCRRVERRAGEGRRQGFPQRRHGSRLTRRDAPRSKGTAATG